MILNFICIPGQSEGDYNSTQQTITFSTSSEISVNTITVPILGDNLQENTENFFGNLRFPAGTSTTAMLSPNVAEVMITDNNRKLLLLYYRIANSSSSLSHLPSSVPS